MENANFSKFVDDLIKLYQTFENAIGLTSRQNQISGPFGHVITLTSLAALGYFGAGTCNTKFLRGGFAAGFLLSYIDLTKQLPSLKEGALFPMDKEGSFAFQKVCALAILTGKNYAPLTGFFAGNAAYHYVKPLFA